MCLGRRRLEKIKPALCVQVREVCLRAKGTRVCFAQRCGCLPCAHIPLVVCWKKTHAAFTSSHPARKKWPRLVKNQKGAQQGHLTSLFKGKAGSTGTSAQGPWPSCAAGRGVQAARNPVTGRCECGDSAARGWEWDSPNSL